MFDKTRDQMNNWRWDNPHTLGDQFNPSNPQTTSSGKVKCTRERFSRYSSDDLRVNIRKQYFRPGGMAPSEWTRSIRAVRDIPVADYSAAGVNATRCVSYRPLIAVLLFLLVFLVSYFK
jgi:hypothetical protein